MKKGGKGEDGEDGFEGVKVICYDSADWVRKNFKAKVDKHNEVGWGFFNGTLTLTLTLPCTPPCIQLAVYRLSREKLLALLVGWEHLKASFAAGRTDRGRNKTFCKI